MMPKDKTGFRPSYLDLHERGILEERVAEARERMRSCRLCPRECRVNRLEDERGFCKTGRNSVVSSYSPHFGEEDPLVGTGGSGTIFFSHCNLLCLFCQNYEISHLGEGRELSVDRLARVMLHLQEQGCHNINFVSPSHVVPQILAALPLAIEGGLKIPLVYNTGGYDSLETLRLLEGIFDLYMPDLKFMDEEVSQRYCRARDYPERARAAIREMHRQVGDLIIEQGLAKRGLLVRQLVMPGMLNDSEKIFRFLASQISENTYVNIMPQYHPAGKAGHSPELRRSLNYVEFLEALKRAREIGLQRLDKRN